MIAFPNVKINIGLYITGERPDGYRNLESIFYPVPFTDVLEIVESDKFSFHLKGIDIPGNPEDNLCVKAYRMLKEEFDLPPVEMHLLKNIPAGAGLGGGSSDGAFTLKLLNEQFSLGLDDTRLEEYAARLGSDCPFFIRNTPMYVTGRGEVMEAVDLSLAGWHLSLVMHPAHISTAEAFKYITPWPAPINLREFIKRPVTKWKDMILNDFEPWAFHSHPVLRIIRNELYNVGAEYVSMTGTGSAIYALSRKPLGIANLFPDEKTWETEIQ